MVDDRLDPSPLFNSANSNSSLSYVEYTKICQALQRNNMDTLLDDISLQTEKEVKLQKKEQKSIKQHSPQITHTIKKISVFGGSLERIIQSNSSIFSVLLWKNKSLTSLFRSKIATDPVNSTKSRFGAISIPKTSFEIPKLVHSTVTPLELLQRTITSKIERNNNAYISMLHDTLLSKHKTNVNTSTTTQSTTKATLDTIVNHDIFPKGMRLRLQSQVIDQVDVQFHYNLQFMQTNGQELLDTFTEMDDTVEPSSRRSLNEFEHHEIQLHIPKDTMVNTKLHQNPWTLSGDGGKRLEKVGKSQYFTLLQPSQQTIFQAYPKINQSAVNNSAQLSRAVTDNELTLELMQCHRILGCIQLKSNLYDRTKLFRRPKMMTTDAQVEYQKRDSLEYKRKGNNNNDDNNDDNDIVTDGKNVRPMQPLSAVVNYKDDSGGIQLNEKKQYKAIWQRKNDAKNAVADSRDKLLTKYNQYRQAQEQEQAHEQAQDEKVNTTKQEQKQETSLGKYVLSVLEATNTDLQNDQVSDKKKEFDTVCALLMNSRSTTSKLDHITMEILSSNYHSILFGTRPWSESNVKTNRKIESETVSESETITGLESKLESESESDSNESITSTRNIAITKALSLASLSDDSCDTWKNDFVFIVVGGYTDIVYDVANSIPISATFKVVEYSLVEA